MHWSNFLSSWHFLMAEDKNMCVSKFFMNVWKLRLRARTHQSMHTSVKQQNCVTFNCKKQKVLSLCKLSTACLKSSRWSLVSFPFYIALSAVLCLLFHTNMHKSINRFADSTLTHKYRRYWTVISAQPALPHTCAQIPAYVWFLIKRTVVVCSRMLLTDPLIFR